MKAPAAAYGYSYTIPRSGDPNARRVCLSQFNHATSIGKTAQEEANVEANCAADKERLILNRVAYRFIPFLILCYFVNFLDRVNVGFAKLTMDTDLGLSDTAFGFGAGIFFLAYFLFEVPSNVIMDRVGARIWIARIMLSWGIVSGAMAFIPQISAWIGLSPEHTFYGLRFLLGVAEARFFPASFSS